MKYHKFIFRDWHFNETQKILTLTYGFDSEVTFAETFRFDFDFVQYNKNALEQAMQTLFILAGVSYFKAYMPHHIEIQKGELDEATAKFYAKTYQKGLGEFFYINRMDPETHIPFHETHDAKPQTIESTPTDGLLVGIGGGKDSLVSVELLRGQPKVATWSVGHHSQLNPLIQEIGLPHFWVERTWDRTLLQHNEAGAYNGHIPISAIIAAVGTVVAILTGYRDVVVSNESSTSEPNMSYQGVAINHQYSKSLEFEQDYQQHLQRLFGDSVRYYSFLRPLGELHIAEIFSKTGFQKYRSVFSSCNRAFTHTSDHIFWCGECPKCAFVFLILTPFVKRGDLENLFGGKNLLLTHALEPTYRQLLGIEGDKPLECVGTVKESRAAMRLAQQTYSELSKYEFELPEGYDYKKLASHSMPGNMYQLLISRLD